MDYLQIIHGLSMSYPSSWQIMRNVKHRSPDKSPPWKPEPPKVAQTSSERNPWRPLYMSFDTKWYHNIPQQDIGPKVLTTTPAYVYHMCICTYVYVYIYIYIYIYVCTYVYIFLWRATLANVSLHHPLKQSCQQTPHYKHRPRPCREQLCPGLRLMTPGNPMSWDAHALIDLAGA